MTSSWNCSRQSVRQATGSTSQPLSRSRQRRQLAALEIVATSKPEALGGLEEAVALLALAGLAVAEHAGDVERQPVGGGAAHDLFEEAPRRLVASGREPADARRSALAAAAPRTAHRPPSPSARSSATRARHCSSLG